MYYNYGLTCSKKKKVLSQENANGRAKMVSNPSWAASRDNHTPQQWNSDQVVTPSVRTKTYLLKYMYLRHFTPDGTVGSSTAFPVLPVLDFPLDGVP